jgi:hypothetical protein
LKGRRRTHDDSFVAGAFEITPNTLESIDMFVGRLEGITGALVNCKGNIRTGMTSKVEQHSDDTGVVDDGICGNAVGVFWKRGGVCWSVLFCRVVGVKTKSIDDTFSETGLGEGNGAIFVFFHVDSNETCSRVFFANPNLVSLQVTDELVNGIISRRVDEEIVNVDNDYNVWTKEETGVKGRLTKSMLGEMLGKIVEEVTGSLFETVEGTLYSLRMWEREVVPGA